MIKHSSQRSLLETDALARITLLKDERTQVVQQIKGARTSLQLALRTKLKQAITTPDAPVLAPLSAALRPFQGTYDSSLASIRDRLVNDRAKAIGVLEDLSPHSERSFDALMQACRAELNHLREQSATTHERLFRSFATRNDEANYTPAASAPASVAAPPSISPPSVPSGGWGD